MAAFLGYPILACQSFVNHECQVVAVSGNGPNVCGHALFFSAGRYFHIAAGFYAHPTSFVENEYKRYLAENEKEEWGRDNIILPKPQGASEYLCRAANEKWLWGILANNCVTFVEEILRAGGFPWRYDNCIAFEWVKRSNPKTPANYVSKRLQNFKAPRFR